MLRKLLISFALIISTPIYAHEFWIAPGKYEISAGETIFADFLVGSDFRGATEVWADHRTANSFAGRSDQVTFYSGTLGDRPAMQVPAGSEGLWILAHETTDSFLTYTEWEKFTGFVNHKDFQGAVQRHVARGLPQTGFRETYRRYAKSLVAVGNGAGRDGRLGFAIEIVALDNPYTTRSATLPVQVWYNGAPRADTQVEVFEDSPSGKVTVTYLRTDEYGVAQVPIRKGHVYMIDNVALEEKDGSSDRGEVWHSKWANLTFAVPD